MMDVDRKHVVYGGTHILQVTSMEENHSTFIPRKSESTQKLYLDFIKKNVLWIRNKSLYNFIIRNAR
jgi:hypothetical protein